MSTIVENHADRADDRPEVVALSDRYSAATGRVQLTGVQALVRLPIDQHRLDLAAGLKVGTFISGYEGSPLGGYDLELGRQRALLDANDVVFSPGLNEESAATSVQGSQLAPTLEGATRDGVVGIWYGKAPGLDRATDALRHGNMMGSHPQGGAVVLVGDDPAAKSSTLPCASEAALADLQIPFVYPSDSQEVIDLGLHAIELSRVSGLWVGMKIATAVADGTSPVDLGAQRPQPVAPEGAKRHTPTSRLLQPTLGELERDLVTNRLELAREYGRLNRLNHEVGRGERDRIGIVAAGRTYRESLAALDRLGIAPDALRDSEIRMLHVQMPWPMDPGVLREFADGLDEVIVVEEKRAFLESALRDALYGVPGAPRIHGKRGPDGTDLFPAFGELDADAIGYRLGGRLRDLGIDVAEDSRPGVPAGRTQLQLAPLPKRAPYFCSGCPHNTSTKPLDGSLTGAGIGCHALVLMMDESQVGAVTGLAQMGGEGLQWIGMAPFVDRDHYFQNIGDGTFDHSGSLAVRASVAAGVNITYKLLFNSAVAMTGGQRAVGAMDVPRIVDLLRAEGVSRIAITTEDPKRYAKVRLPKGVQVRDRRHLDEVQRELAAVPGVTVLIHDQECATEKRRKRKRGQAATPATRVVINERMCEGCGDCGRKSNCLSVQPVDTEYGRKTQIHQASCNLDFSCLEGDCPAFMTVTGVDGADATAGGGRLLDGDALDAPLAVVTGDSFGVRMTGVGGTGVVTASQILATAGLLAGWTTRSLDQTGLAQKGGAVVSDIIFSRVDTGLSNKITAGECDLLLGCDVLVAVDDAYLSVASAGRTVGVLNTAKVATGHMVADVRQTFPDLASLTGRFEERVRPDAPLFDAQAVSIGLFGHDQFVNMLLIGAGYQTGALPIPAEAIEEAIRLNGLAVETNLQAFRYGRLWVQDRAAVEAEITSRGRVSAQSSSIPAVAGGVSLDELVTRRAAELTAYQDEAYADRFREVVARVRAAETPLMPESTGLAEAVTRNLFKLMAYKDEYEVARLALDPAVLGSVRAEFGSDAQVSWKLHPPMLRAMGMDQKMTLGPWARPALRTLMSMRKLRGTPLDPFGRAHVRNVERALVTEYVEAIDRVVAVLDSRNHPVAVELAGLPDQVRGYEEIKLANVERYRTRLGELLAQLG